MKTVKKTVSIEGASREAKRLAAVILEVLSGTIQTGEAAEALGISTSRYYMIESRAIEGLLRACEPRPKGYIKTPEREIEALRKEIVGLERECTRYKALVRVSQRAVGISKANDRGKGGKVKRRRKSPARALLIAKKLKGAADETPPSDTDKGGQYGKAAERAETGPQS